MLFQTHVLNFLRTSPFVFHVRKKVLPFKLCVPLLPVAAVPARLPQPCSIRFLVEQFLDISAVPRRSFFEVLATFATNELERDKLLEFSSAQGQDSLHSYCNRPHRTALEVRDYLTVDVK